MPWWALSFSYTQCNRDALSKRLFIRRGIRCPKLMRASALPTRASLFMVSREQAFWQTCAASVKSTAYARRHDYHETSRTASRTYCLIMDACSTKPATSAINPTSPRTLTGNFKSLKLPHASPPYNRASTRIGQGFRDFVYRLPYQARLNPDIDWTSFNFGLLQGWVVVRSSFDAKNLSSILCWIPGPT